MGCGCTQSAASTSTGLRSVRCHDRDEARGHERSHMKQLVTTAYGDVGEQQLVDRPAHEGGMDGANEGTPITHFPLTNKHAKNTPLRGRGMWMSDLSSFL